MPRICEYEALLQKHHVRECPVSSLSRVLLRWNLLQERGVLLRETLGRWLLLFGREYW